MGIETGRYDETDDHRITDEMRARVAEHAEEREELRKRMVVEVEGLIPSLVGKIDDVDGYRLSEVLGAIDNLNPDGRQNG